MKINVLDASTLGADLDLSVLEMNGKHKLTVWQTTSQDEMAEHLVGADILLLNKIKLNSETLSDFLADRERYPLKLICETATGYDNIDIDLCRRIGIAVTNVIGYSSYSVSQVTASIVLSLVNHLPEYAGYVNDGSYSKSGCANSLTPVFHELYDKTWGVLGLGRIGRQTAKIAEALGCRVLATKRTPDSEITCVDVDTLCRESDILTIHVPLNDETYKILNRDRIASMKHDAILVNMARGAVIDEQAVADAILGGQLGGFGADVYSVEPFLDGHPFCKILEDPRVCLTPHMSWGAYEARVRCIDEIVENIKAFERGERRYRVD